MKRSQPIESLVEPEKIPSARIDAYLNDIAFTARQALLTDNEKAKALCVRMVCAQTDRLADLCNNMEYEERMTEFGQSFDVA
jgi:hypothetical protein